MTRIVARLQRRRKEEEGVDSSERTVNQTLASANKVVFWGEKTPISSEERKHPREGREKSPSSTKTGLAKLS